MLLLRIFILLIGAHAFVFLSGLIYHYLERPTASTKADNVERVVEQYLVNPNRPKRSKQEVVHLVKDAFAKDESIRIRKEFSSLWKCYLFSLTSITTIGNSGLYLQSTGSRLFFIFTTLIGLFLYACLLHNIAVVLLTIYKSGIDFVILVQIEKEHAVKYRRFADLAVVLLSFTVTFLFLFVTAMAAILSGHGYMFGLFAVFDAILTVGNLSVLIFVYPWNEIGFVISINLIILMGLSFFYASCYLTFHLANGNDFNELIQYWWSRNNDKGYEAVDQEEDGPFKTFMEKSIGDYKKEHDKGEAGANPFLNGDSDTEQPSKNDFDSLTPEFLCKEHGSDIEQAHLVAMKKETMEN